MGTITKRLLTAILTMAVMIVSSAAMAEGAGASWGSNYDAATEFSISTEAELRAFAGLVNSGKDFLGKTVRLANSIAMSDEVWVPIGSGDYTGDKYIFAGTFDGQGYVISNLKMAYNKQPNPDLIYDSAGLFGNVGGTVKNVRLERVSMSAVVQIGGIAGCLMENAAIIGCTVEGSISGEVYEGDYCGDTIGGIVGGMQPSAKNVRIENCVNKASVEGSTKTGGIIGDANANQNGKCQIVNCDNQGDINGRAYVGGIAGTAYHTVISGCRNEGNVVSVHEDAEGELGNRAIGGIVGNTLDTQIENCANTAVVTALEQNRVGGIAGWLDSGSTIADCANTGDIQGGTEVGGIVGVGMADSDIYKVSGSSNTGAVTGSENVGGIAGQTGMMANPGSAQAPAITDCTNSGPVAGGKAVGGIVGHHNAQKSKIYSAAVVQSCINTGTVPANGGAIVGFNDALDNLSGVVQNNYWPESIGADAVASGAGAGTPVGEVKNNSAWREDGTLVNPDPSKPNQTICDLKGHSFGSVWTFDAAGHWHACTLCGQKADEAAHIYGEWITTKAPTATEDGSRERQCKACGYKVSEVLPATGVPATPTPAPATPTPAPAAQPPKTGDGSSTALWTALLALSSAALIGAAVCRRRKKYGR